ncbi:MAG: class I SAM-dependent methyltransferase, partial [Thermoanaerobaculia bacterium]
MPTIDENLHLWGSEYDWKGRGEEWSEVWGGSRSQWLGSILPRIRGFLPAGRALEIGCGHGRWSLQLRPWCRELVLLDLAAGCVDACRELFRGDAAVRVERTDGRSLTGVGAGEIDFAFSFDSLVHAELDVLAGYAAELARALAPAGVAFLHHSNFGAVLAARPGSENRHWRGESASAEAFAECCRSAGLACPVQEIVDWGGIDACDVFSVVTRPGSSRDRDPIRRSNPYFMGEAQSLAVRAALYGLPEGPQAGEPGVGGGGE